MARVAVFGGSGFHEIEVGNGLTGAGEVDISPDPRHRITENVDRSSYPHHFGTDLDGRVLAVNAAILEEIHGSNLEVPAGEALRLLCEPQADAPD